MAGLGRGPGKREREREKRQGRKRKRRGLAKETRLLKAKRGDTPSGPTEAGPPEATKTVELLLSTGSLTKEGEGGGKGRGTY